MINRISSVNLHRILRNLLVKQLREGMPQKCLEEKRHDTSNWDVRKNIAGEMKVYGICPVCKRYYIEEPTEEEKRRYEKIERELFGDYVPKTDLFA